MVSPAHKGAYSYRWSDGSPLVYSDWGSLNSHCKTEICAPIIPRWNVAFSYYVSWSPATCSSPNRFICEKPKSAALSLYITDRLYFLIDLVNFEVRLVTGVTPNRGRAEFFLDGTWNRVCMGTNASQPRLPYVNIWATLIFYMSELCVPKKKAAAIIRTSLWCFKGSSWLFLQKSFSLDC